MPSKRVPINENNGEYFVTFVVSNWQYVFDRFNRFDKLAKSLEYLRINKYLKIYAFVFMINHIHLIIESKDVAGFIRDFKRHTSITMRDSILANDKRNFYKFVNKRGEFQFWHKTNMPIKIETDDFFYQKKEYIEYNPVKKGYVEIPTYWYWSSANKSCFLQIDE